MSNSIFFYVEFESFADAGHRVHTANDYAEKLRSRSLFAQYCLIAPPSPIGAEALARALRGYDVVDLSLEEMLTPAVEHTNIDSVGRRLKESLRVVIAAHSRRVLVYSHMPSPFGLLALYVAIRLLIRETGVRPHVLVRLCMVDEEWAWYQLRLSQLISMICSDPIVGPLFRFTTESKRLSQYYLERSGVDAPVQFNPFPDDELVVTKRKHRYHRALYGDLVNFVYLGEAREEKGFQHLPALLGALRASGVRFLLLVHTFSNTVNNTGTIQNARELLNQMAVNRNDVRLIHFAVPGSIYTAHQHKADVVVMPYQHDAYRIRGSGVAFEAIRSNAFMLAAEDLDFGYTFMESGRVVEYRPDEPDVSRIQEIAQRVLAVRGLKSGGRHPADEYRECFFESVVDFPPLDEPHESSALEDDRFPDLMEILADQQPIHSLTQTLVRAGFF